MLRGARNEFRRVTRCWAREYWKSVLKECEDAEGRGDSGGVYRGLRKLGVRGMRNAKIESKVTTEEFKRQFEGVSAERFENDPQVLEDAVDRAVDLWGNVELLWKQGGGWRS